MSSLTIIPQDETPYISTNFQHPISIINPLTYGGFTEHMGRCIYGGIYDPNNKHGLVDEEGFRTDVIDCMRELQVPVVRWPGGNFVATYRWQDGIGPRSKRPRKLEPAWLGVESNQFGTDEFMRWCDKVGCEPYIALNMGTGTLEEAMAWLEYCNSDSDTYWSNLRRGNGRDKPYGVKYWALGNEIWGPWQVEQMTKEDYAKKALQWAKGTSHINADRSDNNILVAYQSTRAGKKSSLIVVALKLIDPKITLVLCGQSGISDWDRYTLQHCIKYIDMHSIHWYTAAKEHLPNTVAPLAAERAIEIASSLVDLARCEISTDSFPNPPNTAAKRAAKPLICFDEWNVWDPQRAPGQFGAEERYDVSDMCAVAVWLNVFVRQSRHIGMATIAQSVNVISPLMTTEKGVVRQTTYWPLLLFSKYMRGAALATHVRSPVYLGRTEPVWLGQTVDLPLLDVSAALSPEGWVNLAVVNAREEEDVEVDVVGVVEGHQVQVFTVGGNGVGLRDVNVEGDEKVGVKESTWDGKGRYVFERRSFTLLRWKAEVKEGDAVHNVVVNGHVSMNGIPRGDGHGHLEPESETEEMVEAIRRVAV